MTANEKAFSIFNKMYKYQLDKTSPVSWELAKKQAIVVVDEIKLNEVLNHYGLELIIGYWNEVETELKKM